MSVQKLDIFGSSDIDNTSNSPGERVNRLYQDSSFKIIFKDERYQRLFLKDEYGLKDWNSVEIQNIELEEIFTIDTHNDVCFRAGNELIILLEHQSSINNNMSIRMLFYVAEEYKRLFKNNDKWKELFNRNTVKLPEPKFYVVYTGDEHWDKDVLYLSEAFGAQNAGFLELKVPIYTKENATGIVGEYTSLIWEIRRLKDKGFSAAEAVSRTVRKFSSGYELSDILNERADIMDWLTQHLTDEEKQKIIFESREKERLEEITEKVTEKVTAQVTEKVTAQVTEKVTAQETIKSIRESYELLLEVGTPSEQAIKSIALKRGISESTVRKILEKD